jgi:hypothetical protein
MTPAPTLRGFVARILLLLPPCFAAWFVAAPWHAAVVGPVALQFVEPWRTGLVSALARNGYMLSFETELEIGSSAGRVALLVAEVNPLLYTYGLALFLALMLATRTRVWKILLGVAIMLVFQAWSVAFDVLVQIAVLSGPEVAARAGLLGWRSEAIAIGYQFGTLIFPSLVPVLLWAAFNRAFIAGLRPEAAEAHRVLPGEFRPEEEYLRRVVDPQQ